MAKLILPLLVTILILTGFTSCTNTFDSGNDIVFPDSNVSYQLHVEPFMRLTCAYYGCHSFDYRAGGRDLSTYDALMDAQMNLGLIIPYQSNNSILIKIMKLEYYHTYSEQWRINQNQVKGLAKWIDEGALRN